MKLDRNINPDGRGKYALIKIRALQDHEVEELQKKAGGLHYISLPGEALDTGEDSQFFVIRYKDKFAAAALSGYASAVEFEARINKVHSSSLKEYAQEIRNEAYRAAKVGCEIPD